MPVSSNIFNKSNTSTNPKLLDFFVKNKSNAYALKELQQQFGANVSWELFALVVGGQLEQKFIQDEYYYHLKPKK
jgi:hypothetical protein